jgi:hydrogenase maturation protease
MNLTSPVLVIGYGNLDRQDDGVAWHILNALATRLNLPILTTLDEVSIPPASQVHLLYALQLVPEMAEVLAAFPLACFVDAHTGHVPEDVHFEILDPQMQTSPFTHHMTPNTCLALAQSLYGQAPSSILVSVRGYEFGFSQELSQPTASLANQAVQRILAWLETS